MAHMVKVLAAFSPTWVQSRTEAGGVIPQQFKEMKKKKQKQKRNQRKQEYHYLSYTNKNEVYKQLKCFSFR